MPWFERDARGLGQGSRRAGYVVLLVDSLGPRGVASVCDGPKAGVNFARGTRDALQAAEHLRRQRFVDRDRVALVGFSWGAMVGLLASSRHYAAALDAGPGFAAVASFYPGCFRIYPANGAPPYEILNPDIAQPLLVLMGEADTEAPPAECISRPRRPPALRSRGRSTPPPPIAGIAATRTA
jgi:dienelactone hydrolase